jgi:hypothetical protein
LARPRWGDPAECRIPSTTTPVKGFRDLPYPFGMFFYCLARGQATETTVLVSWLLLDAGRSGGGSRRAGMRRTPFLRYVGEPARVGARRRSTIATTAIRTYPGRYVSSAPSAPTLIYAWNVSLLAQKSLRIGATIHTGSWLVPKPFVELFHAYSCSTPVSTQ